MTQKEFLAQNVYNTQPTYTIENDPDTLYFSEEGFSEILNKAEHYGIAIYDIKSALNGEAGTSAHHETFKKKATDPTWYKGVFKTLKNKQKGFLYAATYKVSKKLLNR